MIIRPTYGAVNDFSGKLTGKQWVFLWANKISNVCLWYGLTKLVFADYNSVMSTQLFEEEAPVVVAPKNGRAPRTTPASKPEITLTDPFADEQESIVSEVVEASPETITEPMAATEPVAITPQPTPETVVMPTPTPVVATVPLVGPRTLPEERPSLTLTLKAGGCEGLVIVGLYDDGTPGEVLLLLRNAPTGAATALEAYAETLTLALPYGVPVTLLATQLLALISEPGAREAAQSIATSLSARFA